jgi:hypothetical protein
MAHIPERECLQCGMLHEIALPELHERGHERSCIKCDSPLFDQTDGSTLTVDIAHHHETVAQALQKLERSLNRAWQGYARQVRLVVGGGAIREAVLGELHYYQGQGYILDYTEEGHNPGAIVARIR